MLVHIREMFYLMFIGCHIGIGGQLIPITKINGPGSLAINLEEILCARCQFDFDFSLPRITNLICKQIGFVIFPIIVINPNNKVTYIPSFDIIH